MYTGVTDQCDDGPNGNEGKDDGCVNVEQMDLGERK